MIFTLSFRAHHTSHSSNCCNNKKPTPLHHGGGVIFLVQSRAKNVVAIGYKIKARSCIKIKCYSAIEKNLINP